MAEESVARTETKYALDEVTAATLRGVMDHVMLRDPHGGDDGYLVRSLYFDTPFDQDYHDKIDGFEVRQKVRLRIYSSEDQTAKLELKRKVAKYQWKKSVTVSRDDAYRLIDGQYAAVGEKAESPFAKKIISMMERQCYRPRTVVEFHRLAFLLHIENTRVTFDTKLQASQSLPDLFSPTPAYHPILHPAILEVKYTNILPSQVKIALATANRLPLSISKYCLGRQISFF